MEREAYNAYQREYQLRRYHRRRAEAVVALGGVCVVCSSDKDLEIDHINWKYKTLDLGRLWSISKARFEEELKKCQLLCSTHHEEKTRQDQVEMGLNQRLVWEHGTVTGYFTKKCRCSDCSAAGSEYNRNLRGSK